MLRRPVALVTDAGGEMGRTLLHPSPRAATRISSPAISGPTSAQHTAP
jgi:hypothetical protein